MKRYLVTLPIAGHVTVEVEAEDEDAAIDKAQEVYDPEDATWETLTTFITGNVCYCPHPWEAEAEEISE